MNKTKSIAFQSFGRWCINSLTTLSGVTCTSWIAPQLFTGNNVALQVEMVYGGKEIILLSLC